MPFPQPNYDNDPFVGNGWNPAKAGEECVIGGGIRVDISYGCSNFWQGNASDEHGRGATNSTFKVTGSSATHLVNKFEDFVSRAVAESRPFVSALFFHEVHFPRPAMPEYYAAASGTGDPDYMGSVQQWDAAMGRLIEVLEEQGVRDNTLLWITSDNGPTCKDSPSFCSAPLGSGRSMAGLRACKGSTFEGGLRGA